MMWFLTFGYLILAAGFYTFASRTATAVNEDGRFLR